MADVEPRKAAHRPVFLAGACIVVLLIAGLLPAYRPDVEVGRFFPDTTPHRAIPAGDSRSLLDDVAWPYTSALALTLTGLCLAGGFGVRGHRAWAAWGLLGTTLPAAALFGDYVSTDAYAAPPLLRDLARAAASRERNRGEDVYAVPDVATLAGAWTTAALIAGLVIAAAIWLGRHVEALSSTRAAVRFAATVVALGIVSIAWANATGGDCTIESSFSLTTDESRWGMWLTLYLPAVPGLVGIGALTRRRWLGGGLLLASAAGALLTLFVVALLVIGPCLS